MDILIEDEEQTPQHEVSRHGPPRDGARSGDPHVLLDAHTALHLPGEESDESASETHIWRGID